MDRRVFGLRSLAHAQKSVNHFDSSESEDDEYKERTKTKVVDTDFDSSSESSRSDSDETYGEKRDGRMCLLGRNHAQTRAVMPCSSSSSEGSDWSESESGSDYQVRSTRAAVSTISYKEKSESSEEEALIIEEDNNIEEKAEENKEEVETIEKILRHRIGRKGATGSQTVSYVVAEDGDPNVNLNSEVEETEVHYLIKWLNWSHIHSSWESEESLNGQKVNGLKKLENYKRKEVDLQLRKKFANREDLEYLACQQEMDEILEAQYSSVERIISSKITNGLPEYLVKWEGLPYVNCTVEDASLIERLFPKAVKEYSFRLKNTCTPNANCKALKYRPKFVPFKEQPARLGRDNQMKLRDYQLEGLNWLLHAWCRGNSVILADEMGLGKTLQTISFFEALMSSHEIYGPFLVLVPLSTITNWHREFCTWAPHMNVIQYVGDVDSRNRIRLEEWCHPGNKKIKFNALLTTYEILLKDKATLGGINWAVLAVDEAHRLKNDDSLLYKSLITFNTNHRLLVTGTPLQNSLKELWALLHFLMPKKYERWEDFEENHKSADKTGFHNLHAELAPYLLRRVKKDVEKSLPAKVEQILRVEMSKLQKQFYKLILTKNYKELCKGSGGKVSSFINIVMELKKCCNHAYLIKDTENGYSSKNRLEMLVKGSGKLILLDKLLLRLKETGHRVLIFSQMVRMLDILEDYMRLRNFAFQRLDGSVSGENRKQALDHFNAEGSQDFCFLLSTRAGGLGLNLATADTVIIFDSDWNPQNDLQAQARAHRIGQKNQVSVYRLVTKTSVEEKILESAKKKMVLDHLVIQRMDTTGKTVLNKDAQSQSNPFNKEELNAILKFGAEDLFKDSDEEDGDFQVDIDDILLRAETRSVEELHNAASSELLSCFKVVSFDNLEDEELEGHEMGSEKEKSWDNIIPEVERRKLEDEELHQQLVALNPPPRSRKYCQAINYDESSDRKRKRKHEEEDSSEAEEGVKLPRKRGRPRNKYSDIHDLSNAELKRLIKSIKKFGRPQERFHAIARDADLLDKSQDDIASVVKHILAKCSEVESMIKQPEIENSGVPDLRLQTFKLAKVIINPKSILQSAIDLEPLCVWVEEKSNVLPPAIHFRDANFGCKWTSDDDVNLLKGVYEYGFGTWDSIQTDEKLHLSKILPDSDQKPQSKHLSTRVEYLLKKLHKYYDTLCIVKKPKKSKALGGQIEKPITNMNGSLQNGVAETKKKKKIKSEMPIANKVEVASLKIHKDVGHDSMARVCGLSTDIYLKCREDMRPLRKVLKCLGDPEKTNENLLRTGNFIGTLLQKYTDLKTYEQRHNELWQFVSAFIDNSDGSSIYQHYKSLKKQEAKIGNKNLLINSHSNKESSTTMQHTLLSHR